jgi:hypothetical protein
MPDRPRSVRHAQNFARAKSCQAASRRTRGADAGRPCGSGCAASRCRARPSRAGWAAFRDSKDAALDADRELRRARKAEAEQEEQAAARPATLRQLLEYYALDLAARGKGEKSVGRIDYTCRAIEALLPELLDKPLSAIADDRQAQERKVVIAVFDIDSGSYRADTSAHQRLLASAMICFARTMSKGRSLPVSQSLRGVRMKSPP